MSSKKVELATRGQILDKAVCISLFAYWERHVIIILPMLLFISGRVLVYLEYPSKDIKV